MFLVYYAIRKLFSESDSQAMSLGGSLEVILIDFCQWLKKIRISLNFFLLSNAFPLNELKGCV